MKKALAFLLTTLLISIAYTNVNAESFYEGESTDIYAKSVKSNGVSHYEKIKIFKSNSGIVSYCLEPFNFFNSNDYYDKLNYFNNLENYVEPSKWDKITKIANFGYGYQNHIDKKWYAITQVLIWKELYPESDFYFTNTLNGNRINIFQEEMNEILSIVNEFNLKPNFQESKTAVAGSSIILTDTNNVIGKYYQPRGTDVKYHIEGNKIYIENLKPGNNSIIFSKKLPTNGEATYWHSRNSSGQDMISIGGSPEELYTILLYGTTNTINIKKIDKDTKTSKPSGDAEIKGTILGLYKDDKLIKEYTLNEDGIIKLENIEYGNYYIKEIKAGTGYTINPQKYEFKITEDTKEINIIIENEVIKKDITIHKEYGEIDNTIKEPNISFDILDKNNTLIDTITTDENGNATINLPFGKYMVQQRNTNYGYNKVEDFLINVANSENNNYTLYDYKIPVPNTGIKESNSIVLLLFLLLPLLLLKRKNAH